MPFKYHYSTLFLMMPLVSMVAQAQTFLSPNQINGSIIPYVSDDIVFTTSDGNWISNIQLPATANNNAKIKIVSNAGYSTNVMQVGTDLPQASYNLQKGDSLEYRYSSGSKQWELNVPVVCAANNGQAFNITITADSSRVVKACLADGQWAPLVTLPSQAKDNTIVMLKHTATWASRISPANIMFESTLNMTTGDAYAFRFNARLAKWLLVKSPTNVLNPNSMASGAYPEVNTKYIPRPSKPISSVTLATFSPISTYILPAIAGDRDRINIESYSGNTSYISNKNVDPSVGSMHIVKGQKYSFMYDQSVQKWMLLEKPSSKLMLGNIPSGVMSRPTTPVTEVLAWDGNYTPTLTLPSTASAGDKVEVKSNASWGFTIRTGTFATAANYVINQGESILFIRSTDGTWKKETDTIRLLLVSGQGAVNKLGTQAAVARQLESLRLTNEALENSGSKFRFQLAKHTVVPDVGRTLGDVLQKGRDLPAIQNVRNAVSADAVYYEGIEEGCGLAWVNSTPNAYNMIGSGSLNCGTTVMRHELGHNMGLPHGDGILATVMSGNSYPFFATPKRYDIDTGLPLSAKASLGDEVTLMDVNAPKVARFR